MDSEETVAETPEFVRNPGGGLSIRSWSDVQRRSGAEELLLSQPFNEDAVREVVEALVDRDVVPCPPGSVGQHHRGPQQALRAQPG